MIEVRSATSRGRETQGLATHTGGFTNSGWTSTHHSVNEFWLPLEPVGCQSRGWPIAEVPIPGASQPRAAVPRAPLEALNRRADIKEATAQALAGIFLRAAIRSAPVAARRRLVAPVRVVSYRRGDHSLWDRKSERRRQLLVAIGSMTNPPQQVIRN